MPRTQINIKEIKLSFKKKLNRYKSDPKKKILNNKLINKILAYSAKKIKANPPLLYSTLNPDTNSDSPSAKSKGVRLVSAKEVQNHTIAKGKHKNINQIFN